MYRRLVLMASPALLLGMCAAAQDTRNVVEPSLPPVCTTLDAKLTAVGSPGTELEFAL